MRARNIFDLFSRKTPRPPVSESELLDDLDAPFKSALLSMYRGDPQLGIDGQRHFLQKNTKVPAEEGMWLYEQCRKSKPERSLEIGLAYGFSTLFFLAALARNNFGHHSAIDPYQESAWHGIGLTITNALAPSGRFRFIEDTSVSAAVQLEREGLPYDVIFIDGGHRFEEVLVDFFLYAQLCKVNGLIILDDMWMSSVKSVASFVRTNRSDFSEVRTPKICACFREWVETNASGITFVAFWSMSISLKCLGSPPRIWSTSLSRPGMV
jgi:predicted O-methyltransferase YrrM